MSIVVPSLTYQQLVDAAADCLAGHEWDGMIPVPIEDIVDVKYRLDLVPTPDLEARFSTVAFNTHDLAEIRVDDFVFRKQPYRLRFSLAHELGHLILHGGIYQQLSFTTPAEWKEAMGALGQANYARLEDQADAFAGLLLIPPKQFVARFNEIATVLAGAGTTFRRLPKESQDYAVKGLARTFNVSTGANWFRVRDENLV